MNYKSLFLLAAVLLLPARALSEGKAYIIPSEVKETKQPMVLLNGEWQFRFEAKGAWTSIQAPGEAAMQGYAIEHDRPFRYRKSFSVPADFRNKTVILRFDGVYSMARLWVNGSFVREHHGGFTRWDTDVTSLVKPGKKNVIELEVTDRLDEISYASGYAHHPIGGILRDVSLFALPTTHLYDFNVETRLDSLYRDASLRISFAAEGGDGDVSFELKAPDGSVVPLSDSRRPFPANQAVVHEFSVKNPLKWDAEHPNLYTLTATVYANGKPSYHLTRRIGFREVKIVRNQMLVNGRPVKLRGACRHDMHPTLGRISTAEIDSIDAALFKQANMNFVRTSHYPSSETFLDHCDRVGLYVESESAVCFVATHRQQNYEPSATHNDPEYAGRYLLQFQEMVKSFRTHPSVLFWSLGNESLYGTNFRLCHDWLKTADATRPAIFSYPGTQKDDSKIFDLLSMHYPSVQGISSNYDITTTGFQWQSIPALFDEWAHVPCYTYATLRDDPNIREFWGMSLDRMWANLFETQGGLGGAIWGYIDEIFFLPEPKAGRPTWKEFARRPGEEYTGNCVGYGEWGIVDVWRRLKPEFWSTKKAYSPVRLLSARITSFTEGQPLLLPVYNRFDHTNLDEIRASYIYKGVEKQLRLAPLAPRQRGLITIPAESWADGEELAVGFYDRAGALIDNYTISFGHKTPEPLPAPAGTPLRITETEAGITVAGQGFEVPFSKSTGLITAATAQGATVIEQGPFLHLNAGQTIPPEAAWRKTKFAHRMHNGKAQVSVSGEFGGVAVDIHIIISPNGQLQFDYAATGPLPAERLRESGLKFILSPAINHLSWRREAYWSYYPSDSFAGPEGSAALSESRQAEYGAPPVQPWPLDTRNYYYWGDAGANCANPLTQQAKGTKENCYSYSLATQPGAPLLSVRSADASVACRINRTPDDRLVLYANNQWDYPDIGWGNDSKKLYPAPCYGRLLVYLNK